MHRQARLPLLWPAFTMGSVTASAPVAESFGDIADDFSQIRAANIVYLIPIAFVCYDYLLTCGREVQYIWRRGFSGPALLFYTLRYVTLSNVLFASIDIKPWVNMSDYDCAIVTIFQMALDIILLATVTVFSALRAYALTSRNTPVLAVVIVLGLVGPVIVLFTFTEVDVGTITLASSAVLACGYGNLIPDVVYENWMIGARTSSILVDMLVLVITWTQLWHSTRPEAAQAVIYRRSFTMVFLCDGTAYFLVLLIGNLVGLSLIRQIYLLEPASTWISALTAIMTWRFILDLHEADDARRGPSATGSICGADTAATAQSFPDLVFRTETQSTGVFGVLIVDGDAHVVGGEDVHRSGEGAEASEPERTRIMGGDAHV